MNVADTRLNTVLNATVNPIQAFMAEVLSKEQTLPVISKAKSYFVKLVLKDCNFDLAQVESKMRQLYSSHGTNLSKVMKPYMAMLSEMRCDHNCDRDALIGQLA